MSIDTVRYELQKAYEGLSEVELNTVNYTDEEVVKQNCAVILAVWRIREALAALSTIDPEAIRRECANRAAIWLAELHGVEPDPALPWSKKLMRIRALQSCTLRAAILGAEPVKEDTP